MKENNFLAFWKECWNEINWLHRVLLIVFTPYVWLCYGIAMSCGMDGDER